MDKGLAKKLFLTRKLFMTQMNSSDTMEQHLNKLGAMAKKLVAIGTPIPIEVKVMVLLMHLLESYQFFVTSLESLESIDPNKITWVVITTRSLNEELMRKEKLGPLNHIHKLC
jgi:hypothetical protein